MIKQFTNLYIFGDSYSDTGNAFNATGGVLAAPPNYSGRFSNGRLWVDYLADGLEIGLQPNTEGTLNNQGINFSFAGSTTGLDNLFPMVIPDLPELPGLQHQIDSFTSLLQKNQQSADPNALYVVWAGTVDYGPFVNGVPQYSDIITTITNISTAIKALIEFGAKNILLVNLIDISKTPLMLEVDDTTNSQLVSQVINKHNQALEEISYSFEDKVNLILFDVKSVIDEALAYPKTFGFNNTTQACSLVEFSNPDEYVFWDQVHLTTRVNQLIANAALAKFKT
ncbi:SGNH/GDSL hydrolase family protein [Aetokthonos hydrillicola Thurmond2011]|jgi:phospholipase/lecithinase/hemolysin|uniref:SGNH/GDSL hydrolase family protein n=1 Tax=Aetokthonos hydrillicola Thurmond2011 TaxID=2712845 RepID=A0AAP5I6B2_9CYAN|nr:SGNH/GDSL hydrolase family protein [Aetokthonos hydrillicola]MBO3463953.1 SGNH/GDSL hydrolase family protein [Aetokthonos hydrillicola CCALA 1050]MBW4586803.1 SGNH/GDSL hydrolase family protein [Aetokthonos hydrillicola CCALA 1050]MDR9895838.1 SGNH/GDSL hydrolase family protein [Aetokthonos hydrillicola Thurmond2011]